MLDSLALLTGPRAEALLTAALNPHGEQLVSWRVRSVDHGTGRGTTVAYDVRVRDAAAERSTVLGATSGPVDEGADVVRLTLSGGQVVVWRFPGDPALPGLPAVTDEHALRDRLERCGLVAGPVEVRVRSYRPGRRAVVEVRTPTDSVFVKVLRPSRVESLHARHVLLREAGLPVPPSLGRFPDGVLVLGALPGTSLRARLREGGEPALDGGELRGLLDRLPPEVCTLPRRRSWSDAADHYAAMTATALPQEAVRCGRLAEGVRERLLPGSDEPVHGDFYEAQLLVHDGRVTGLLDLDTVGPGRRADDLACLLAHADVLAEQERAHARATRALASRWLADFEQTVDPVDLRARVAGVLLSLATGPHRVQQRGWQERTRARLELAQAWLDSSVPRRAGRGAPVAWRG